MLICVLGFMVRAALSGPTPLPHIILMLADDLGHYEVGYQNPQAISPNIDNLADDGIKLERHYVFHMCGPTRASMMSGRLPYHVTQRNGNDLNSTFGVDLRMTFMPAKLKQAGYATSMVGKSHLGARSVAHLPINRGFDQHFGYLGGGEDHFTQISGEDPVVGPLVDLWRDHGPAYGENGTFSGYLYSNEAERVIKNHAATTNGSTPLFMYLAWHLVHAPLEVPPQYLDSQCADNKQRQQYHGMVTVLDEGIGNVTRALRDAGMYDNSLIIFWSDNGGSVVTTGRSGNNYPLKGGKTNDFEGGVRVLAFISGGFIPKHLRGSSNHAYMHGADWYATLCGLAGVNPDDAVADAAIPPIDSIDQWSTIMIANATWEQGPRQEMVLSSGTRGSVSASGPDAAMIQGRYKIVTGHQGGSGFWTGPVHPNSTGPANPERNSTACGAFSCCDGCLYDIQSDPSEHVDLRTELPEVYASMRSRLAELVKTEYLGGYIQPGISCIDAHQAKAFYRGYRGPQCFEDPPDVPTTTPPPVAAFHLAAGDDLCLTGAQRLRLQRCGGSSPLAPQWTVDDEATGELRSAVMADDECIKLHEPKGWSCDGSNATSVFLGHCGAGDGSGAHKTNYFFLAPAPQGDGADGLVSIQSHDCPNLCLAPIDGAVGLSLCSEAASQVWRKTDSFSTNGWSFV